MANSLELVTRQDKICKEESSFVLFIWNLNYTCRWADPSLHINILKMGFLLVFFLLIGSHEIKESMSVLISFYACTVFQNIP